MQTERGETPAQEPDDDRERSREREGHREDDDERRARDREGTAEAEARRQREEAGRREQETQRQERDVKEPEKTHPTRSPEEIRQRAQNLGTVRQPPGSQQEREEAVAAATARDELAEMVRALPKQKQTVRQAISLLDPMYRRYYDGYERIVNPFGIYIDERGNTVDRDRNRVEVPKDLHNRADWGGKNEVREFVEDLLRAQEEDDVDVRPEDQQQIRAAINTVIADDEFRAELATRAQARALAHMGAWTAKYISAEALSQVVTGFLPHHLKELQETEGVKEAIDILESKDKYGIKGEYYRAFESVAEIDKENNILHKVIWNDPRKKSDPDRKVALKDIELKFKIIEQARSSQKIIRRASHEATIYEDLQKFKGIDDLIKITLFKLDQENPNLSRRNSPKQAIEEEVLRSNDPEVQRLIKAAGLTDEAGNPNKDRIKEYDTLIYKIDRAFQIAQRLHHTFGMSALWDGPRWKKGTVIPEKYTNDGVAREAGENELVQLHPKVKVKFDEKEKGKGKYPDEFAGRTIEIDLSTAVDADEGSDINIAWKYFRSLRKATAEVTTKAWREFYYDEYNWNNIDFDKSARKTGRGARQLSRVINHPLILQHPGEAHAGVAWLRRLAYLNVPSLLEMNAYTNLDQLLKNWGDDYTYMKEGWVNSRLKNVDKFKARLVSAKPRLIGSTNSIKDFVNTLNEVKEEMREYLTDKEYGETMEHWVRGFLEFRRNHSPETDLMNLDRSELERQTDHAQTEGLINTKRNEAIKRDMFAPKWLKALDHYRPLSHDHYPGKIIWKFYGALDSTWQFIKGLSWFHGITSAIGEFLKQAFVMPK